MLYMTAITVLAQGQVAPVKHPEHWASPLTYLNPPPIIKWYQM